MINPQATTHLFVCGSSDARMALRFSLDGGGTWKTSTAGGGNGFAIAVAVDVLNDQTIYLGGYVDAKPALFKSNDQGTKWTDVSGSISSIITSLAVDPDSGLRVYAGTGAGVYVSDNGGSSWSKKSSFDAACLKVNPLSPNEVFAGGASGLFRSLDFGKTWTSVAGGMSGFQVSCFALTPEVGIWHAGTMGGGVFKKNLSDLCALIVKAGAGGTTNPAPGTYFCSPGASVELEAVPDQFFRFKGWSGSVDGSSSPIAVIMNTDQVAVANFAINIFAPLNFSGVKKINRSLLLSQYVNILSWQPHPDNADVAKYRLYLVSGTALNLLAEVGAGTFEFWHKNIPKDQVYRYAVCAVNAKGLEGEFAYAEVK